MLAMGGTSILGAAGALLLKFLGGPGTGGALLIATLAVWVLGPLAITDRILKNQDI
jgi:hypothetical protein